MEKKIERQIETIFELYTRETVPEQLKREVFDWLLDEDNAEYKDEVLRRYLDSLAHDETYATYRTLAEILEKLGMDAPQGDMDSRVNQLIKQMGDPNVNPGAKYYYQDRSGPVDMPGNKPAARTLRRPGIWMRVAAVLIPAFVLFGAGYLVYERSLGNRHVAQVENVIRMQDTGDGHGRMELADSTRILINTSSVVRQTGPRQVSLAGQAYFSVAKDTSRPFVVSLEDFTVTVYGTEFDVDASAEGYAAVSLYSGSLKVESKNGQIMLAPGQRLRYDRTTGKMELTAISGTHPEWITSRLDMTNKSMGEIFDVLEWYYGVSIETDAGIDTGEKYAFKIYPNEEFSSVLSALSTVGGNFQYSIEGRQVKIKSNQSL